MQMFRIWMGRPLQISGHFPADLRLQKPVPMPDVGVKLAVES